MHELSVTENLLKIALSHAKKAKAKRITDLYLVIGQLSSLIDDSVQFYWDIISRDTLAEGARLHFKRIATELYCMDCQQPYLPEKGELACPICEGIHIKILTGEEFRLDAIEIE